LFSSSRFSIAIEGYYICSAISMVGAAMAKAHIKISSPFDGPPPIIRFGPTNQTLPTETMALLPCELQPPVAGQAALPHPVRVEWLKNGASLDLIDSRFKQTAGTLQINSKCASLASMSGHYRSTLIRPSNQNCSSSRLFLSLSKVNQNANKQSHS
jgi:roundabout axon guidance receptor 2